LGQSERFLHSNIVLGSDLDQFLQSSQQNICRH
jgi:hypothetical protein